MCFQCDYQHNAAMSDAFPKDVVITRFTCPVCDREHFATARYVETMNMVGLGHWANARARFQGEK